MTLAGASQRYTEAEATAKLEALVKKVTTSGSSKAFEAASERLDKLRYQLPKSAAVGAKLVEMAQLEGASDRWMQRCVLAIPYPPPAEQAAPLARLISGDRPWSGNAIVDALSDIATYNAGLLAGTGLPKLSACRQVRARNGDYLAGLLQGLEGAALTTHTAAGLLGGLAESVEWKWLEAPLPQAVATFGAQAVRSMMGELLPLPSAERSERKLYDLTRSVEQLCLCEPVDAVRELVSGLQRFEEALLLAATIVLTLTVGAELDLVMVEKVAGNDLTRLGLFETLHAKGRLDAMPAAEQTWLRLAQSYLAKYLAEEDGTLCDTFELVAQKEYLVEGEPRLAIAVCSSKSPDHEEVRLGLVKNIAVTATAPLAAGEVAYSRAKELKFAREAAESSLAEWLEHRSV